MFKKRGFSSKKYIEAQSKEIKKRIGKFDKLYLEFGGKLTYDGHASRVLPGFKPTTKIDLLKNLGDLEIIYCINSEDIISKKRLGDFGLSYEEQTLKDIKDIRKKGLEINHLCITFFNNNTRVKEFAEKIKEMGINVVYHNRIPGYPNNLKNVLNGFLKQPFIETKSKLVIVTGASGGSGKMAVAMSQVYHERKMGVKAAFSKYELFPIWNLDLSHPINTTYEAATADLGDYNMIDPYHLKAYNKKAVNYNRDVENFSILKKIYLSVAGRAVLKIFKSPTDMGMNMAKKGIINDEVCRKAAKKEIIRREKVYLKEFKAGRESKKTIERIKEVVGKIKKD